MSRWFTLAATIGLATASGVAQAQQTYGPTDFASADGEDVPAPLIEPQPCEAEVRDDGAIVVCRELPDSERYMSPLPRPVQSDRVIIPGLTDPPCWVTGAQPCLRGGYAPPPIYLIDLSIYPEPLSARDAAAVVAVDEDESTVEDLVPLGTRVPIDLAGED